MEVNGWKLFEHILFKAEYDKLLAEVESLTLSQPKTFESHNTTKLLKRITVLISEEIPADPGNERLQQGKTLGAGYKHWKRAKFGKDRRYRLFFRYDQTKKVIIYAWMNNDKTLRKEGDKNDPYALFAKGLKNRRPPNNIEALLGESTKLDLRP